MILVEYDYLYFTISFNILSGPQEFYILSLFITNFTSESEMNCERNELTVKHI